ncbi:thioredoxin-disulfide reductase [Patescibacteria group bacterium]|nr:thioredoxin-disulfide reductase [Patescibacteria group bacterium]
MHDVIIVGGGAAGLTSAIYASRRNLKTLVISQDTGGQAATTPEVENYPGFTEMVDGFVLMQNFKKQAEKFGTEFITSEVTAIEKVDGKFSVKTPDKTYDAESVILAFGLTHRHLGVVGEEDKIGKGVSYCATCDGPLYRGKTVAVVGGGASAIETALFMSEITKQVYIIHRRDQYRGEEVMVKRLNEAKNIEQVLNSQTTAIKGQDVVEVIEVKNDDGKTREIKVDGVFVEIGLEVKSDFIKGLVDLDERNQIKISAVNETNCPGIYAAGDVTDIVYKQIVISAGEGAKAALSAYNYLQKKKGLTPSVDWGKKKA